MAFLSVSIWVVTCENWNEDSHSFTRLDSCRILWRDNGRMGLGMMALFSDAALSGPEGIQSLMTELQN